MHTIRQFDTITEIYIRYTDIPYIFGRAPKEEWSVLFGFRWGKTIDKDFREKMLELGLNIIL